MRTLSRNVLIAADQVVELASLDEHPEVLKNIRLERVLFVGVIGDERHGGRVKRGNGARDGRGRQDGEIAVCNNAGKLQKRKNERVALQNESCELTVIRSLGVTVKQRFTRSRAGPSTNLGSSYSPFLTLSSTVGTLSASKGRERVRRAKRTTPADQTSARKPSYAFPCEYSKRELRRRAEEESETHDDDLRRSIVRTSATFGQQLAFTLIRNHAEVDELDVQVAVDIRANEDILELDVAVAEAEAGEVDELCEAQRPSAHRPLQVEVTDAPR